MDNSPRFSQKLIDRVQTHATAEGPNISPVPGVSVYRADHRTECSPAIYEPCVIFVVQGSKRGYLDGHTFDYNPSTYLAFSLPMPVEAEILEAAPDKPFLGLGLKIKPAEVSDILLQLGDAAPAPKVEPHAIASSPLTADIMDALERLVAVFDKGPDAHVVGPLIRRELLYRILMGEQGGMLASVVQRHSHFERIGGIMRQVHEDCASPLSTDAMADMAGMSKTTLHETFKSITSMSPLQYVKSIRLHQARVLMLNEGVPASTAAFRVGYASASQFSREFKRFFGVPPSQVASAPDYSPQLGAVIRRLPSGVSTAS